jgi:hypothetical protein
MSPALTEPVPMVVSAAVWVFVGTAFGDKYWEFCVQPLASTPALANSPAIERRRVGKNTGATVDASPFACDDNAGLLTARNLGNVAFGAKQIGHRQSDILAANR